MSTTKTITKLEQMLTGEYKQSLKEHKLVVAKRKEGKDIISQMPEGLANIDWYTFRKSGPNKWYLETMMVSEEDANKLIDNLKAMGIIALPSKHLEWNNRWQYTGYLIMDGIEVTVKIDGGSKPPNCRIEETREVREVVTYKAICPDFTN